MIKPAYTHKTEWNILFLSNNCFISRVEMNFKWTCKAFLDHNIYCMICIWKKSNCNTVVFTVRLLLFITKCIWLDCEQWVNEMILHLTEMFGLFRTNIINKENICMTVTQNLLTIDLFWNARVYVPFLVRAKTLLNLDKCRKVLIIHCITIKSKRLNISNYCR